jgi:hypothetical protein
VINTIASINKYKQRNLIFLILLQGYYINEELKLATAEKLNKAVSILDRKKQIVQDYGNIRTDKRWKISTKFKIMIANLLKLMSFYHLKFKEGVKE